MPIWIWGVLAMVLALLLSQHLSFTHKKLNNIFNYLICIGVGAMLVLLLTSASVFHAINWLSPLQFSTFTMICGIMGFYGGVEIVGKKINMYYVPNGYKTLGKFMKKLTKTTENTSKHIVRLIKIRKTNKFTRKQFESQERLEKHLEKISDVIGKVGQNSLT